MNRMNTTLTDLIQTGRIMDALAILDRHIDESEEFPLLRALLREYVSDMNSAREDIENYTGKRLFIKDITHARILAKLGYVDEANEILSVYPLLDAPQYQIDPNGIPFSQGIIYRSFDMERMGINYFQELIAIPKKENIYNSMLDTLLVLGAYDTLRKSIQKFDSASTAFFELGEALITYDQLPRAESFEHKRDALKLLLDGVRGWLSIEEGLLLQHFAQSIDRTGKIVEIGSFHGRSTICLASGNYEGRRNDIYSIDPHSGIEAFGKNNSLSLLKHNLKMRRLDKNVEYVVDESQSVVKTWAGGEINLLFIDALHDYDNVKADFEAWEKYVSDGGYVLFHDSVQSGVNRFLQELLKYNRDFVPFGLRDSLFVLKKSRQRDENKNIFFAHYLKNKGKYFEHWMQRDKNNIIVLANKLLESE